MPATRTRFAQSKFYLLSKSTNEVAGPYSTVDAAMNCRCGDQEVYAGCELNQLEADAMVGMGEGPSNTIMPSGGYFKLVTNPDTQTQPPIQHMMKSITPVVATVQEALAAKEKSPRQQLLAALMKGFSGDNGEKAAQAFVDQDADALTAVFDSVRDSLTAKFKGQATAAGKSMRFKDPDGLRNSLTFTSLTEHGLDGNGATVYSGISANGWPSVFVVKDGKMVASSINDGSCNSLEAANAKADYAVQKRMTHYWDSKNPIERYMNHHRQPPILMP